MSGAEELSQVRKCSPRIEDVLDDDDVSALDAAVNIFLDLYDSRAAGCAVPAAHLHEFELALAADRPQSAGEIAEEVNRAFQDSKQDDGRIGRGDACADLLGELAGFRLDIRFRDENFEPH